MPAGQPDLDNPSLGFSSQEILDPDKTTKLTVIHSALHKSEFLIFPMIFLFNAYPPRLY